MILLMAKFSSSVPFLYADDFMFLKVIKCVADSETLQADIGRIYCWRKANGIELNASKYFQMSFIRKVNQFSYN